MPSAPCTPSPQYVVIPTRRSTAEAFQIVLSHLLGDAGSPYLIGLVSTALLLGWGQTPCVPNAGQWPGASAGLNGRAAPVRLPSRAPVTVDPQLTGRSLSLQVSTGGHGPLSGRPDTLP